MANATRYGNDNSERTAGWPFAQSIFLFISMALAAIVYIASTAPSFAGPVIGTASTVVRDVKGQLAQSWRTVVIDDNVHQDELIKTGAGSAARLVFADRTDFMIGANSEVVLDKFIYDSQTNAGRLILRATKGLMKFRTGRMSSRSYRINTPVATVGVRGTEFVIQILTGGATYIKVIEGEVVVNDHRQVQKTVEPGQTVIVYPPLDHRAATGPVLMSNRDFSLNHDTREMISQVVFSESKTTTQITANAQQKTSVKVQGNTVQVIDNSGNQPVPVVSVKDPSGAPPAAHDPVVNKVQDLPSDPVVNSTPDPVSTERQCLAFDATGSCQRNQLGEGIVEVVPNPAKLSEELTILTTGSPVAIEDFFKSLMKPFRFTFDDRFDTDGGTFCVYLEEAPGEDEAGEETPSDLSAADKAKLACEGEPLFVAVSTGAQTEYSTFSIDITDPALYLVDEFVLTRVLIDDESGKKISLTELDIEPLDTEEKPADIPLPPAIVFMAMAVAGFGLAAQRKARRDSRRSDDAVPD